MWPLLASSARGTPELTTPVDAINKRIRLELKLFDDYVEHLTDHGVILPFLRMDEMISAAREEVAYWKTLSMHGNGPEAPKPTIWTSSRNS